MFYRMNLKIKYKGKNLSRNIIFYPIIYFLSNNKILQKTIKVLEVFSLKINSIKNCLKTKTESV